MKGALQLTGGASIEIASKATLMRDRLVTESSAIVSIEDDLTMSIATDSVREIKDFASTVESSRVEVKGPVLEWGRTIDGLAKKLITPLDLELSRLKKLMNKYAAEQSAKAQELERVRLAELKRIEDERLRIEKQKAEAEAAEAKALSAEDDAKAAQLKRESEESERKLNLQSASVSIAPVATKIEGVSVKKVWKWEVVDLDQLVKAHPKLCRIEPSASAINEEIRNGYTAISGLRIWQETEAQVRR